MNSAATNRAKISSGSAPPSDARPVRRRLGNRPEFLPSQDARFDPDFDRKRLAYWRLTQHLLYLAGARLIYAESGAFYHRLTREREWGDPAVAAVRAAQRDLIAFARRHATAGRGAGGSRPDAPPRLNENRTTPDDTQVLHHQPFRFLCSMCSFAANPLFPCPQGLKVNPRSHGVHPILL